MAVAQVDTFTPANVEIGDIFTLTVTGNNGSSFAINYTAVDTLVATVCTGLETAWNASTNVLCTPITAADNTTDITLTADAAGVAFEVVSSAVNGGATDDQTLTRAATTANSGASDWRSAANWSGGVLPGVAVGDDVYLDDAVIYYGLDQSGISNALASLNTEKAQISVNPGTGAIPVYLQIKTAILTIGLHNAPGTPIPLFPVNIDLGSTAAEVVVHNAGTNNPTTEPAIRLLANSASTNIEVRKGTVGIANNPGETTTVGNIIVNYSTNQASDANVFIGDGVTLTNYTQKGGKCSLGSAIGTTGNLESGTLLTFGTGAIATLNITGGTATLNALGTITALNVSDTGTADFTKSGQARTVTTPKIDPGGTIIYDPSIVTMTTKIQLISSTGNIEVRAA